VRAPVAILATGHLLDHNGSVATVFNVDHFLTIVGYVVFRKVAGFEGVEIVAPGIGVFRNRFEGCGVLAVDSINDVGRDYVGGLGGIWLGSQGYLDGQLWWLLGNEGLEYLEVGKLWQGGLLVGFVVWAALCVCGFRPLLDREPPFGLAHMILYAGGSIALLFVAGFLFTPGTNIAVTEFWRWWVVHMWVEGAFEFFIVASGVWNFAGAGVLGFFINLPLVNYYEHGTYLTVGHAHAAMFGAFGFLALGMATYMLQLAVDPARWDGTWLRRAFWLWNVGLALMVFVSLLPVGFLQLEAAFTGSYAAARSLAFYERPLVQALFWARLPGDTLIIAGTVVYAADLVRKRFALRSTAEDPGPEDVAVADGMLNDD
jgi:nitric oxide reductase large subunit